MSFVPVGLHGRFFGYDGQRIPDGKVTFTPLGGWLAEADTLRDFSPRKVVVLLEDGEFVTTLVTPDDDDADPLKYSVEAKFGPDLTNTFVITLPVNPDDGVVLELADRDADGVLAADPGTGGGGGGFGGTGHGGF